MYNVKGYKAPGITKKFHPFMHIKALPLEQLYFSLKFISFTPTNDHSLSFKTVMIGEKSWIDIVVTPTNEMSHKKEFDIPIMVGPFQKRIARILDGDTLLLKINRTKLTVNPEVDIFIATKV